MATNKQLLIDLTALTPDSASQLASIQDDMIAELEKSGKRTKPEAKKKITQFEKQDLKFEKQLAKLQKQLEFESISKKGKEGIGQKLFGKFGFQNLLGIASNPQGFLQVGVTRLLPFIGTALLVTGAIAAVLRKIDDFQKAFVDNVDDRINLFRSKQQQVDIQGGITQLIITSASGSVEPRDAYNTFEQFNNNQAQLESNFKLHDTSGVD